MAADPLHQGWDLLQSGKQQQLAGHRAAATQSYNQGCRVLLAALEQRPEFAGRDQYIAAVGEAMSELRTLAEEQSKEDADLSVLMATQQRSVAELTRLKAAEATPSAVFKDVGRRLVEAAERTKAKEDEAGLSQNGQQRLHTWRLKLVRHATDAFEAAKAAESRESAIGPELLGMMPSLPSAASAPPAAGPAAAAAAGGGGGRGSARPPPVTAPPLLRQASNRRTLTDQEKQVLIGTSRISGHEFLPWNDDDARPGNYRCSTPYEAPGGRLRLSRKQQRFFARWKRPGEFMRRPTMIHRISPLTVTQELVGDCSFVSSLCVTAQWEQRFGKKLISNIIYPQDARGNPIYNPSGRYSVKLHLNGCPRDVRVDDLLPVDGSDKLLCTYSNNRNELWPSIIEKAFLRVAGSYDWPGSSSSKDLFVLTGWVPESQRTTDDEFDRERTWQRLVSATQTGDCLITIATSQLSEAEEARMGLVGTHAYAVLDVREIVDSGRRLRMLRVKNPWARHRWKGRFCPQDTTNWTASLRRALQFDAWQESVVDNGIFWLEYTDALQWFPNWHFNWNRELFLPRVPFVHDRWPVTQGPAKDSYMVCDNPQYQLRVNAPLRSAACPTGIPAGDTTVVWLLLVRHVTRMADGEDAQATAPQAEDAKPYVAVHLYGRPAAIGAAVAGTTAGANGLQQGDDYHGDRSTGGDGGGVVAGERQHYPAGALIRGVYFESPYILTRINVPPGKHTFTVVPSQFRKRADISYSLFVMSPHETFLSPLPPLQPIGTAKVHWAGASDGGRRSAAGYYDNPQFSVVTQAPGDLLLTLRIGRECHGQLRVWRADSRGGRVLLASGHGFEEVACSQQYRQGYAYLLLRDLAPGAYTVLASKYDEEQSGVPFMLSCAAHARGGRASASALSPATVQLQAVPLRAPSGSLRGAWAAAAGTAVGCRNHGQYERNPKFRLVVGGTSVAKAHLRLRVTSPGASQIPVHAALFPTEAGALPSRAALASAEGAVETAGGKYTPSAHGVMTPRMELVAGVYCIIVSTFDPINADFVLDCFAEGSVTLSSW